jgi:hypothetical protein
MDPEGQGLVAYGLSSRSPESLGGHDVLRSLRAEGEGISEVASPHRADAGSEAADFASELAAIASSYRAKIAALRMSLLRHAIAAATRALRGEKIPIRALKERRKNSTNARTPHKAQATSRPSRPIKPSPRAPG